MKSLIQKVIIGSLIAKGNKALKQIDKIAPGYKDYYYNQLQKLIKENKDTIYGQKYNFSSIRNYDDYVKNVPLSDYSDYADLINRISENNEQNVLTKKPVVHFAVTSGTTSTPKLIPIIKEGIDLCTVYTVPAVMANVEKALREKGKKLPREKGLMLIDFGLDSFTDSGVRKGGVSGASIRKHLKAIEAITVSPKEIITASEYLDSKYLHLLFALKEKNMSWIASTYMTVIAGIIDCLDKNWEKLCLDIEKGEISSDIKMPEYTRTALNRKLKPDPIRADELRKIFNGGITNKAVAKLIWPKLSGISAIGTGSFKIHAEKVKRFAGDDVELISPVIEASESLIAVASMCNNDEFIIVPQAGFFEFIPEDDPTKILPMNKLEAGKNYELVLTTISGLYRYRIGDVITVNGFYGQIPKIKFSHRTNVFINIAGEKTSEAYLLEAIRYFEKKTNIKISEYCAYSETNDTPGHYVLLLEPECAIDLSRLKEYEEIIEEGMKIQFGYKYERQSGNINHAKLLIQQKETHLLYRELQIMKGASRNQLKPVRVLRTPEQKAFFTKMIEKNI